MILLETRIRYILAEEKKAGRSGKQATLARMAGVTKSAVGQWLAGKTKKISSDAAENIEKNLGYNRKWLMNGKGPILVQNMPNAWPFTISKENFDKLDAEDKKAIDQYIRMVFRDWSERNHDKRREAA